MSVDILHENDTFVTQLRSSLSSGAGSLSDVPMLVKCVLKDGRWRHRRIKTGDEVEFDRFDEFVKTPPLEGLGAEMDMLRRICKEDKEALDAIDRALQGKHGGDRKSEAIKGTNYPLDQKKRDRSGKALRRLRQDRPDLHVKVLAREMSAHRAAVEAGHRKPTATVTLEPLAAARTIRRHFTAAQIVELVRLLSEPAS